MSKVRLVAYRKAISTSTEDTAYELDLQQEPNISLNFQFADLKEPEKRKANYSQTFKLPFTKKNNEFFQNWFNVNAETLVFDTKTRFYATIYVGTIPQFEGVIQLKSVYQKAQLYDVVVMSSAADLFTNIGGRKLKDVFLLDDGTYSYELNHRFTADNVEKSWDGSATDFYSETSSATQGPSLKDPDYDIQKVVYPISPTIEKFWFTPGLSVYDVGRLRMSQTVINNFPGLSFDPENPADINLAIPLMLGTWITQLRPAVQIKTLFKLIIAKAGFSYTSAFLDGAYFSKIFMTTSNQSSTPAPVAVKTPGEGSGFAVVGREDPSGYTSPATLNEFDWPAGASNDLTGIYNYEFTADRNTADATYSEPFDPSGFWNVTDNYFIRTDPAMTSITLQWRSNLVNFITDVPVLPLITVKVQQLNYATNTWNNNVDPVTVGAGWVTMSGTTSFNQKGYTVCALDISSLPLGQKFKILLDFNFTEEHRASTAAVTRFTVFACNQIEGTCVDGTGLDLADSFSNMYNRLSLSWDGYGSNIYNQVVDIPNGIDNSITQKDFLKDIIERFNLIILPDPNDQTNLLIEPYDTFIGSGAIKHWTDKLDTSKEVIVKDTISMQKKTIELSDKPDIDLMNKAIADNAPSYNVWGKHKFVTDNDYASGIMKNNPIFAPFITQMVFQSSNTDDGTACNMPVQYEFTYEINNETETGYDNVIKPTKPKLFYYSGIPTDFSSTDGVDKWYMHYMLIEEANTINLTATGGYSDFMKAKEFTTFPKCSSYELSTDNNFNTNSRSLLWGSVPPLNQGLYNWNPSLISQKSLYNVYWKSYLNSIYNSEARIMECHMNLNEVDITNFNFSDEIFIKDSYWRVLKIQNYQVGAKSSCKVTLLKVLDGFDTTCPDCGQVVGETDSGQNAWDGLFVWCPETDPDCVVFTGGAYDEQFLLTSETCCNCNGGQFLATSNATGLGYCMASGGSLPAYIASKKLPLDIYSQVGTKTIIAGKIDGTGIPFVRGSNTAKQANSLIKYMSDDIVIKYTNNNEKALGMVAPVINGESHRMILIGYTLGDTRGYAYPEGLSSSGNGSQIIMPNNATVLIKAKGTATVIGGTNATYPVGNMEAFSFYTAFKRIGDTITQLGTVGGTPEFALKEDGLTATCSLYMTINDDFEFQFGLDDTQTDTQRVWQLSIDLDVNAVSNMQIGVGDSLALWQNDTPINLQDYNNLIWN